MDEGPGGDVRLSLTLPGGASLGSYQAGAVAALLVAVEELRRSGHPLVVDAIGGASSGSLVGLIAAHCLLHGLDADAVLHDAWVERVRLDLLRDDSGTAPLSADRLRERIGEVLDPRDEEGRPLHRTGTRQETPLALHVNLTTLQGLTYPVRGIGGGKIAATTYVDWATSELQPGGGLDQLVEPRGRAPLDLVLASAANPGVFPPRLLDRRSDEAGYRANGIDNFPSSGRLWYTDGGLVASEPVGRTLAAARRIAGDAAGRRLHLVVDPRSEGPSGSSRWSDPSASPSWAAGVGRALSILPAQALYDDLRRAAARNGRLDAVDDAARRLGPVLGDDARATLAEMAGGDPADDTTELLRRLLLRLSGLEGMEKVHMELISPLLLVDEAQREVPGLLAGEFLATFGGFLSRRIRESDYALGWASTRAWMDDGLRRVGVDGGAVDGAAAAVDGVRHRDWQAVNIGQRDADALNFAERRSLARLALHVGRVVVGVIGGGPRRRSRRR